MSPISDTYGGYYAEKLWSLLPAIYRDLDPTTADGTIGPLREIVNRVGAQVAVVRRSIDRMWQDQSIETCDDWVIPYIGDLFGLELPPAGQRVDVAKAIYYRRRKGTLPALEEMAADIAGWDVKTVEFFRHMARFRHGLDASIGVATSDVAVGQGHARFSARPPAHRTRTPMGGLANLRNAYAASRAHTAFDEFAHTLDVRRGDEKTGWHNIPHLGVFAFRLESIAVQGVVPARRALSNEYTFDPTGRDVPLFGVSKRSFGSAWQSPEEHELPVPLDGLLLQKILTDGALQSFLPLKITEGTALVAPSRITADPRHDAQKYYVDPIRGRLHVPASVRGPVLVTYSYGSPGRIGAGGYDRRAGGSSVPTVTPLVQCSGGGKLAPAAPGDGAGPPQPLTSGTIEIVDSQTYIDAPAFTIGDSSGNELVLRSSNGRRPVLRPRPSARWEAIHIEGTAPNEALASRLVVDGIFVCGPELRLEGAFEEVTISCTTLDPGARDPAQPDAFAKAIDGHMLSPSRLRVTGRVRRLILDRCIVGGVIANGRDALVEQVWIRDSVIDSLAPGEPAIALSSGVAYIERCTVFGETRVQRLEATSSIFAGPLEVTDRVDGCVRFSAVPLVGRPPRPYACVPLSRAALDGLFASRSFGGPEYARLRPTAPASVATGAEDGSEMGAFSAAKDSLRRRALRAKLESCAPAGLAPILIEVT
jgi:hypothetical protein